MEEKKQKSEIRNNFAEKVYKTRNILKLVANQEYGLLKSSSFKSQVTKLKVQQLKRSVEEFEIDPDISYCKFLRTSDTSCLVGVWQRDMDPASKHSSVYHLKFEYNKQYFLCDEYEACPIISDLSCCGPFFKRMDVTDSCEKNMRGKSFLLYVGNTAISGGRIVLAVTNVNADISAMSNSEMVWHSPKRIWSCASNLYSERFAAGTEKGCFLFNMLNFMEIDILTGDVLSVEFSKNGNLLYCGIDGDELMFCDLREDAWQSGENQLCTRVGLNSVKEIKLLSDEMIMIASGNDGKLWKLDLRMRRPVFQYPGIVNKYGRRPLSVVEELDLLCATGDDNCSRIWSLNSGDLLKSIYPFHQRTSSHACLIAEQRRWFVAVVQDNILTPIFHC